MRSSEGYEAGSRLAPWERQYQSAQTEVWAWEYLIHPGPTPLERLLEVTQRIDRRFGLTADDALDRAIALAFSGRPPEEVDRAAAEALRLNPHGLFIAEEVEAVRKAARQGGSLGFDEHHRRIIAVPDEPPP